MNRKLAIYTIILTALSMGVMCEARARVKASTHHLGPNMEFVYYKTKIIDGVNYESAKVKRTDTLKELNIDNALAKKVLRHCESMLRINEADTLAFVIPLDDDHTHFAVCTNGYLSERTNSIDFVGYYQSGRCTFIIEKTICDEIGDYGNQSKTVTYCYSWGNLGMPYPFDPLVYYITKNYDGTAYLVSGVPVYQKGYYRVIY